MSRVRPKIFAMFDAKQQIMYCYFVNMRYFIFAQKVFRFALFVTFIGTLTACGFSTVQPESSGGARESIIYNDNDDKGKAGTKREVGDPVSEGDVIVIDDAPVTTDDQTFLGWQSNEGDLMQPGDTYTVGENVPEFTAVRHPNEAEEISLSNVRARGDEEPSFALAIDQLTVAVGASSSDVGERRSGTVDLLSWDGSNWVHRTQLTVQDVQRTPEDGDMFGISIELDAGRLVVGAPGVNGDKGEVYLFVKRDDVWTHSETFSPQNDEGLFGVDVALSGGRLYVAQSPRDGLAQVHLYERGVDGTWNFTRSFEHENAQSDYRIDRIAAHNDTVALIGEPKDPSISQNGVTVWTWDGASWQSVTVAVPDGLRPWSVALDADRLVVGALEKDCVIAYQRDPDGTWASTSPAPMPCDDDGASRTEVAVVGDTVVMGNYKANDSQGEVLGFRDTGAEWSSVQVPASVERDGVRAGTTLAMNEHLLVTGLGLTGGPGDTVVATVQPTAALFD